jgi:hypothetical protein
LGGARSLTDRNDWWLTAVGKEEEEVAGAAMAGTGGEIWAARRCVGVYGGKVV